ncbi:flavodoxin [Gemella cuniculi]|uniref:flavodoxin n=1 Tax=Gemella cuniculi TaxID=150240 RepID=UPI00040A7F7B|nr:flavodoxin [Gemella cuniculi]
MKTRKIIFGVGVFAVLAGLFIWNFTRTSSNSGTNSTNQTASTAANVNATITKQSTKDLSGDNDAIVVYFSRTQGVYNGPLQVGNTKRVAEFIAEATNADTYEIVAAKDYPTDYQETTEVARAEQRENARPAIANPLPDLSEYEVVYIGAPVWWSEYPMVVRTFIDAEASALAGKKIIPFTTHEGSGLGNTERLLRSQFTNATVLEGLAVRGNDAINSQPAVNAWLERIGQK